MFIERYNISQDLSKEILNFYKNNSSKSNAILTNEKESFDIKISSDCFEYPFSEYRIKLQEFLEQYCHKYEELNSIEKFNINSAYNIQHYKPGQGYKKYHCERMSKNNSDIVLVFMTFLNTLENAGTRFKYQNKIYECIKGDTLIWPSDFTHTHKGIINNQKDKYIVTGWFSFN
jgi:hypothetical protein